jgi:hypothetical protein
MRQNAIGMVGYYPSSPRKPEQDSASDGGHNSRLSTLHDRVEYVFGSLLLAVFSSLVL